jgi:outer membrane protein W
MHLKATRFVLIASVVASLFALPAVAADRHFEITAYAVQVDTNSNGTFNSSTPNQNFDISFDGKLGYGVAANVFFSNAMSIEFAASEVRPEAQFTGFSNAGGTRLKMIPLTAVLQWHLAPRGAVDPYIGAGAAYILFDDLSDSSDLNHLNVNRISLKDDVGLALNAGVGFALSPNFAITVDGKYVPLKSSATAVFASGPNSNSRVKINPVLVSAGLTFRF